MKLIRLPSEWVPLLASGDEAERQQAEDMLSEALAGPNETGRDSAARALLEALARADQGVHAPALALLQTAWWPRSPALAGPTVRAVLQALESMPPDTGCVEDAALLLSLAVRDSKGLVAELGKSLDSTLPVIRRAVAQALGQIGDASVSLLPRLSSLLMKDPHPLVRDAALSGVAALSVHAPEEAGPVLVEVAKTLPEEPQAVAFNALVGLLEDARQTDAPPPKLPGAEALALSVLGKGEESNELFGLVMLGLLPPTPSLLAALKQQLKSNDPVIAVEAAGQLFRQGEDALALPLLKKALGADDPEVQYAVLTVLDRLNDRELERAKAVVELACKHGDPGLRESALELKERL